MASLDDQRDAYRRGLARSDAARARGQTHTQDWHPDPAVQRDIDGQGAVAEMLVAEAVGRRWLNRDAVTPDKPEDGDVEGGIQVRWTQHPNGHLLVHDEDPDTLFCVLVVNRAPNMVIVGWINCIEGKTPLYWREPPAVRSPAYFVPQRALLPLHLLRRAYE